MMRLTAGLVHLRGAFSGGEIDRIAGTFRDPRVWWMDEGEWRRGTIEGSTGV